MEQNNPSFTRGRRWRVGFNVAIATISAFALVVMANYLAARHPVRYNWANAAANNLSPLTMRVLRDLTTNTVKVTVFFDRNEPLFGAVSSLIKDYQLHCPKLEVEFIDNRYPGRAELVRAQYKLGGQGEDNRVIFDCAGRVRSVAARELSEYSFGENQEIRRSAFKGEQLFTSAILSVSRGQKAKAYFLGGHGEHNPQSEDDNAGYSRFAKMLTESDVEPALIDSLDSRDIPEDCSLLIVAGPVHKFSREELERLDRYLNRGGRMLAAFYPHLDPNRPPSGLEALLANWGVDVGLNVVIDKQDASASDRMVVASRNFGSHPITRPILNATVNFILPRSVAARSGRPTRADAPKSAELAFSGPTAVAGGRETEPGARELERSGIIPLAVAVEKGGIQGVAADRGATRIVVVGTSLSFANLPFTTVANADFANLAVNWLLSRDDLLSDIPPRAITGYSVTLTKQQMETLRWVFLAAAPGTALLIGGVVWLRRRS